MSLDGRPVELPLLFSPLRIGGMLLKNRLVMPPMFTAYGAEDGRPTQRLVDYLVARAKGGVGLIIQEATAVRPDGKVAPRWLGMWDDASVGAWRELVDAVHDAGSSIAVQLHHGGGEASAEATGMPSVAPSQWLYARPAHVMTVPEIEALEDAFASAARRAVAAGYDAVELHGAHGYVITQFLSPLSNQRQDEYGGDLDRRLLFPCNVIKKVRRQVGPDFPISIRLSADEFLPGGITLLDSQQMAPQLVEAGADIVHVSGGRPPRNHVSVASMELPHGNLVHLAAGIKQAVSVPVIAVGHISDAAMAEDVLRAGKADLVAMGRALIADPDLPNKAREGRLQDVRPCIGCHQGCRSSQGVYGSDGLSCLSNPEVGHEREVALEPARHSKNVVVIGGGPGGLEAARIAALRGHSVTLFEREQQLGGRLRSAAIPPGKQDVGRLIEHLAIQVRKAGVDVRVGCSATKASVEACGADQVIVAVGGEPVVPDLPGIESSHVVFAEDVLLGRAEVGQQVAVMGAGMTGCEVAEFLAAHGKQVKIITRITSAEQIAIDLPPTRRPLLAASLKELGVEVMLGTALEAVAAGAVIVRRGAEQVRMAADSLVLAQGYLPNNPLLRELAVTGIPIHVIGDAKECRTAKEAIREGAAIGRSLT